MASPQAILRAAQAVRGPVSPSPAPQGSMGGLYPYIGNMWQDSTQPGYGYAYSYGPPFLPRPPQDFSAGAFSPMPPILPVPIDMPGPGLPRPQPRRWQPYVGYNMPVGQPGSEGYKLASFATLKALGDNYSIMRTCLEIRKQEIRALNWDIVLTPDAAKAYRGDRKAMRDFGERRAKALKFFTKPDPNYFDFSSWLYALMEQVFVYDSLSLYLCPKKGTGLGRGLLGSDLDCLWAIDGSSIRPMMGLHGEMPAPPAVSYQQYEFGVPRADLATMIDDRDLEGGEAGRLKVQLRGDQLIYLPYVPRIDSPYGFSLVEQAIIPIMTGLRKQAYQLSFFDENSIPGVYISPGDASMTPNQVRELQEALNAVANQNAVWNFKVIVLPPGSKTMPQKQMEIVDQADEWIATEVAMVASVNPMELGVLPKVSTVASPFAARELAQAQRSIHQRIATKPTLEFITAIPDFILQQVCGCLDMRFLFDGMDSQQDLAAQNDMDIKDVQSGIKAIDEVRDSRGLVPWDLPETSEPIVMTQNGPILLSQAQAYIQAMINAKTSPGPGSSRNGSKRKPSSSGSSSTGAHVAAQGHAAVTGTSGQGRMNGPVTQRQARRGGALAPAHATAEGAPGHSGGKAATAELEALARHLRKGRLISTWEPVHLDPYVLEVISGDLVKGFTPEQAVEAAKTVVLGASEYAWDGEAGSASLPKARRRRRGGGTPSQQQQADQQAQARRQAALRAQQQALAQQYAQRIRAAFAAALSQAAALIAAFAAGTLTITLAALVAMIADLIRKELTAVLTQLWREAWRLGRKAAEDEADGKAGKAAMAEALAAFLATFGADLAGLISQTRMKALQDALTALIRSGEDPQKISEEIERILGVAFRSDLIAATEASRAVNAAMLAVLNALGVAYKVWRLGPNPNHCQTCIDNEAQGPVPVSALFGGGLPAPPQHPRCMCRCLGWTPPQPGATKAAEPLIRRVQLNGEVTWETLDPPTLNPAGSGAPHYPHDADGRMEAQRDIPGGVPGMTAGGEPPRWDASQPHPHGLTIESGDDGQEMGGPRGTGTPASGWPSPHYMDGYWPDKWPQGGIGTGQAPMSSPGGGGPRGRAPNSVGKATDSDAISLLKDAPKAKASTVRHQLLANYPPGSLAWLAQAKWYGPIEVPLDAIDWDNERHWAAHHQQAKVDEFARQLQAHEPVNPGVGILRPGQAKVITVDGHHRDEACRKLGWPSRMFVGVVKDPDAIHAALETHLYQRHQGSDPQND